MSGIEPPICGLPSDPEVIFHLIPHNKTQKTLIHHRVRWVVFRREMPKTAESGLDGYTFGYTARLAFCGACNLLWSGPHANSRAAYDDERRGEFSFAHLREQSSQSLLVSSVVVGQFRCAHAISTRS